MKRRLILAILTFTGALAVSADNNVAKIQDRLRADGFYQGESTGNYDSATAAAVTRFQIRNGLAISGRLDEATAKALGGAPVTEAAEPKVMTGTWQRLRTGELKFVPAENSATPVVASATAAPAMRESQAASPANNARTETERLRDYIAAFVLAGIDPRVGSELEFFAPSVDYFGKAKVPREEIRRDLVRYDRAWPERRFWLDGEIEVTQAEGNALKVVFPLRYEIRNGNKRAAGKVWKSLTLFQGQNDVLEIVAVDEKKR